MQYTNAGYTLMYSISYDNQMIIIMPHWQGPFCLHYDYFCYVYFAEVYLDLNNLLSAGLLVVDVVFLNDYIATFIQVKDPSTSSNFMWILHS